MSKINKRVDEITVLTRLAIPLFDLCSKQGGEFSVRIFDEFIEFSILIDGKSVYDLIHFYNETHDWGRETSFRTFESTKEILWTIIATLEDE